MDTLLPLAKKVGATAFLAKPFTSVDLLRGIVQLLGTPSADRATPAVHVEPAMYVWRRRSDPQSLYGEPAALAEGRRLLNICRHDCRDERQVVLQVTQIVRGHPPGDSIRKPVNAFAREDLAGEHSLFGSAELGFRNGHATRCQFKDRLSPNLEQADRFAGTGWSIEGLQWASDQRTIRDS